MYLKVLQQLIVTVLQLGKDLLQQVEQTNKLLKDWKKKRKRKKNFKRKKNWKE
jgi:hypothetical protein